MRSPRLDGRSWSCLLCLCLCLALSCLCVCALEPASSPAAAPSVALFSPLPASASRGFGPESARNRAGFITVRPQRHLWYWLIESRHRPHHDPLVLWLTGGPGCSSMIAMLAENGPYTVDAHNLSLSINPYSWNTRANIIYIDQPVNTGFSYTDDESDAGPLTEREIAANLFEFMQQFLAENPHFSHSPFFIAGESYGGHFVPALAAHIVRANDEQRDGDRPIHLRGIAIGNGLVDARSQYSSYSSFAFDHGMISPQQHQSMVAMLPGCLALIERCSQNSTQGWKACLTAHVACTYAEILPAAYSGRNPYDVRLSCEDSHPLWSARDTDNNALSQIGLSAALTLPPSLCVFVFRSYDFSHIAKFLDQPDVKEALGVRPSHRHRWRECNMRVNEELLLAGDWMLNFATDLPAVLGAGVRVLNYAGDKDYICNYYGQAEWMDRLRWSGQQHFRDARNSSFVVDGRVAGSVRSADGLTFVRINDAGHMCPHDQPKESLDMFNRFIDGRPFDQ